MKTFVMCAVLISFGAQAQQREMQKEMQKEPQAQGQNRQAVYAEMTKTWGFVPGFMKAMPDAALQGAWEQMQTLQMSTNTSIPPKYKELIGLAVASQIPCEYCVYAHTEFAKANGANEQELGTAIAESAITRQWSTFLNGAQIDEASFRSDVQKATTYAKQSMEGGKPPPLAAELADADAAMKDMEKRMGVVPEFMRKYPPSALPGAWRTMRDVEMNPNGAIPPKYIVLAGLAVASQVPCHYCVVFDTEMAKAMGANEQEIYEAVALASYTRFMSTMLNGKMLDYAAFKADINKLTKGKAKKQASLMR